MPARTPRKPPDRTKKKTRSHGRPMICLPMEKWNAIDKTICSMSENQRIDREILLLILQQLILEGNKLVDKTCLLKNCNINNLQITNSGKNLMRFQGSGQNEEDRSSSDQDGSFGVFGDTPQTADNSMQFGKAFGKGEADDHDPSEPMSGETAAASTQPPQAVTDSGQPLALASDYEYDSGVEMSDCDSFSFIDDCSVACLSDVLSDSDDDAVSVMDDSTIASDGDVHDIDDGGQWDADQRDAELLMGVSLDGLTPIKSGLFELVKPTTTPVMWICDVASGPSGSASGHSGAASHCDSVSPVKSSLTASVSTLQITCGTPMAVQYKQAVFSGQGSCLENLSGKGRIGVPAIFSRAFPQVPRDVEHGILLYVWPKANFAGFCPAYLQQFPISVNTWRGSQVMYLPVSFGNQGVVGLSCPSHTFAPSRSLTVGKVVEVMTELCYKGVYDDKMGSPATAKSSRGEGRGPADREEDTGGGRNQMDSECPSENLAISPACSDFRGLQYATGWMRGETGSDRNVGNAAKEKDSESKLPYPFSIRSAQAENVTNKLRMLRGGFETSGTQSIAAPIPKPDKSFTGTPSHWSTGDFGRASWMGTFGDMHLVLCPQGKTSKNGKVACPAEERDSGGYTNGPEYGGHGEPASAYLPDQAAQTKNLSILLNDAGKPFVEELKGLNPRRASISTINSNVGCMQKKQSYPYFHQGVAGCGYKQKGACSKRTCKHDRAGHRIHKLYGYL